MHRRLPWLLSCALAACVPAFGLVLAYSPAAGASTAPARSRPEAARPRPLAPRSST